MIRLKLQRRARPILQPLDGEARRSCLETMHGISPFIDTAAVEAWDAWFRWRDRDRLHDLSIEATWQRVVDALSASGTLAQAELMDACASWRLLLDERILATAGTPFANWPANDLVAVINVPMFVRRRFSAHAHIDIVALVQTAKLAVCALDDAALLQRGHVGRDARLRIGVVGMADAIALLGAGYDSSAARQHASHVCGAIAAGCLEASIRLAHDRKLRFKPTESRLKRAIENGIPTELIRDATRYGVRHSRLTAITSQPRLALLANNLADAMDPLLGENHVHRIATASDTRSVRSSGYALIVNRGSLRPSLPDAFATITQVGMDAQLALRAAAQRWIDEPITYPLAVARVPGDAQWQSTRRLAQERGLAEPSWRSLDECVAPIAAAISAQTPDMLTSRSTSA